MRKRYLVICICFFWCTTIMAQQQKIVDSLKKQLSIATTDEKKVDLAGRLSQITMSFDLNQADEYGSQAITYAELSRDRRLMIKAYMTNALRYSYVAQMKGNIEKSRNYYNQAYKLAVENKMEKEIVESLLGLATLHLAIPDADKAMNFTNQAFSVVSNIKNDSLVAACYNSFGDNYMLKGEKLLALKNYFNAQRIGETINNLGLLRACYSNLSKFYASVDDIEKALDYGTKAKDKLKEIGSSNQRYALVIDLNYIGGLYVQKKNYDLAKDLYEEAIRIADTLRFETMKIPSYISLLNMYIESHEPQKAKAFFDSNKQLREFLAHFGLSSVVDEAYGVIYMGLNKNDSARFYFEKALPFFENGTNLPSSAHFFDGLAEFNFKVGDYKKAEEYSLKVRQMGEKMGNLEVQKKAAKRLDSIYLKTGDYKQASFYSSEYYQFKDSIDALGKEKDLLQLQIGDEQQRQERIAKEEEIKLEKQHNLQYMGITIAIATVFIILVLMGAFSVSVNTIRTLGFFAFIFLFEFITLIADNKIHHLTHGEPLKVLAIKIVLIAMLLPLHHWVEHRVIHYLTSHKMLKVDHKDLFRKLFGKKDSNAPMQNV